MKARAKAGRYATNVCKKGSKMKKETVEKIIKTINYLTAPISAIGAIWGVDISVYTAAGCGALASIFAFIQLFCKE